MTPQELAAKLDTIGTGLETSIQGVKTLVEGHDGKLTEIETELKRQEDWIKEVEQAAEDARKSITVGDNYKAAIPDKYRHNIGLAEIHGSYHKGPGGEPAGIWKDPVKAAACATWLQLHLRRLPRVQAAIGREFSAEDKEAYDKLSEVLYAKATNAMEGATAGAGQETIPTPLEAEVLRQIEDNAIVRPLARKMSMIARLHQIPDLTTGISVSIVDENTAGSNVRPVFGQKDLTALKFMALGAASIEILQDSVIGLFDFWLTLANEQLGLLEDFEALEGDGTNFTGLLNASGVNNIDLGAPAAIAATNWETFVNAKWKGRKASTRSRRFNTSWVGAPETLRDLEKLKNSNNDPLLTTPMNGAIFDFPAGASGMFLNFPAYSSDQIQIDRGGGSNESAMYFGPFGRSMIFGDLMGITVGTSEHVGWSDATIGIRMIKRTAILVAVPADFTKVDRIQITP